MAYVYIFNGGGGSKFVQCNNQKKNLQTLNLQTNVYKLKNFIILLYYISIKN